MARISARTMLFLPHLFVFKRQVCCQVSILNAEGVSGDHFLTRRRDSRFCSPRLSSLQMRRAVRSHRRVAEVCLCILRAWSWSSGRRYTPDHLGIAYTHCDIIWFDFLTSSARTTVSKRTRDKKAREAKSEKRDPMCPIP